MYTYTKHKRHLGNPLKKNTENLSHGWINYNVTMPGLTHTNDVAKISSSDHLHGYNSDSFNYWVRWITKKYLTYYW